MNKVIHGDCLQEMRNFEDNSIDMVLTSPPYDNLRTYENSLEWGEHIWKPVIKELYRVIKDGGVVVWVVGDATINGSETGTSFKQALWAMECGFNLHDTMIYQKNSPAYPAQRMSNRYTQIFEHMFVFSVGSLRANLICDKENRWAGHKDFSGKLKNPVPEFSPRNNIWKYTTSFNGVTHPAPFPEQLAHDHIISWSNEGDTILDPFAGSGTVGKMALRLNRNYILIEKEAKYIDIIKKRIAEEQSKLALFNTEQEVR